MIHIFLFILTAVLKVIGVLILFLLSLLLLCALLVLFVPVRYRAEIVYNAERQHLKARIGWLLSLVSVHISYRNDVSAAIRIFGCQIYPKRKKKKKTQKNQKKRKPNVPEERRETDFFPKEEPEVSDFSGQTQENAPIDAEPRPSAGRGAFIKKKYKAFMGRIKRFTADAKSKKEWLADVWEFLQERSTRELCSQIKRRLLGILKHISPDKVKGHIYYGSDDPAVTGLVFGLISMFYGLIPDSLGVQPYFDDEITDCDLHVKGHVRLIHMAAAAVMIYFDKNTRQVIENYKRKVGRR